MVAIPRALFAEIQAHRPAASDSLAAIMGLDSEASRPPDTRDMTRECRGVPPQQEMDGAPAVQTPVTLAAGCCRGSITTGATISLAGSFSAVWQFLFGDLSILTVPRRRADV